MTTISPEQLINGYFTLKIAVYLAGAWGQCLVPAMS